MTLRVQCKTGGEAVYIGPGDENRDPHSRLDAAGCTHCAHGKGAAADHHCGMNANLCAGPGVAHQGPCWNPPTVPERPDGCAVCRPLIIEAMSGAVNVTAA